MEVKAEKYNIMSQNNSGWSKENDSDLDWVLLQLVNTGQKLDFRLVCVFARLTHARLSVLAFKRPPQFDWQCVQDRVFIWGGAAGAATSVKGRRGPALWVGCLEELAHEAEAGLADVGAASEHVEDGVDGAAEVSEGCDVRTGCFGSFNDWSTALQETNHLEEEDGDKGKRKGHSN